MTDVDESPEKPKETIQLTKKQELNNLIVLMRHKVKQARVHIISKLTREGRQLSNRKGTEKIQAKAKRKAQRLFEEISHVKKLDADYVSTYALKNTIPLLKILTNSKSSSETRALARLAHHTAVQEKVQSYREKNPHWELQIPVLLEKSKEKAKKLKKKERVKSEKSLEKESLEESEDFPEGENPEDPAKDKGLGTPEISGTEKTPKLKKENLKPKKTSKGSTKGAPKVPKNTEPPIKLNKSEGAVLVQILKDIKELEKCPKVEGSVGKSGIVVKKKPKSAFFIGGEDEPEPEKQDRSSSSTFHSQKDSKWKRPRDSSNHEPTFKRGKLIGKRNDNFNPRSSQFTDNVRPPPRGTSLHSRETTTTTTDLHPSWAAKKRQEVSIFTSFKGKKTTFGDD